MPLDPCCDKSLTMADFYGYPYRTAAGVLSVSSTRLPQLLSPCLHRFDKDVNNPETLIKNRNVEFWASKESFSRIRMRSSIVKCMRSFFEKRDFVEVQTPILAHEAGGAVARPFHTSASEFPGRQISLRIAPELWLKRLVLGGFEKVFEIGPCFRNEGKSPIRGGLSVLD